VHGHSFQVEVAIEGEPDAKSGFIADFGEVERACAGALAPRFAQLARVTVRRDSSGQSCSYTGP